MKVVISVGGSILVPSDIDTAYIKDFAKLANELSNKHKIAIVTGGGRTARKYISPAREFGASEIFCDMIGISATRLNARLLSAAIGDKANMEPPREFMTAMKAFDFGKLVVMGGTHPGHSTDAVSALLAEYVGADLLINASDVDGIYDKDPGKHKDAKRYERIPIDKLVDMVKSYSAGAGKYELVDILAAKIIQRSKTRTIFVNGRDLKNLKNAIEGKKFTGTVVENGG
ncbi:MAG: UMP kinase [Candidatus Altiarchaeales archaeon]|nr:UMP kinase [Candidatus Altiarchaeota archaeon]MBU4341390.1 UMP kinase [Candidatus Altiarchaeota archaeon]MBU4406107.1 UMP kinase [Candidatus Altiarchaeota archaeon]MBU4437043.1 UMP kinase [Candidatus Altiarchaeota archaeon]MCG2782874.1 UMP kinase [Candidatus Altiarchaeales archaeon]